MTTSPLGVWTPNDGDDWDLTIDLASMAVSIDDLVLATRARYEKTGTTVTGLGTGAFVGQPGWVTGTNPGLYLWNGTTWARNYAAFSLEAGVGSWPAVINAGAGTTVSISFTPGRFTQPPIMSITPNTSRITAAYSSITTTGAVISLNNWTPGGTAAGQFHWTATQMLSASANG